MNLFMGRAKLSFFQESVSALAEQASGVNTISKVFLNTEAMDGMFVSALKCVRSIIYNQGATCRSFLCIHQLESPKTRLDSKIN